ncbi:MAG TPA: DUF1800 family protein [Opitutaceae bacterium]|jgi:uncharacterized protein (DUF1800 family)
MPRVRLGALLLSVLVWRVGAQPALLNLSTLGSAGNGSNTLYGGFVVSGGPETVLIRAIGPGLAPYGVANGLSTPALTLYSAGNVQLGYDAGWPLGDSATFAQVGAFSLTPGSTDSAIVATLAPGNYTALITGAGGPAPVLFETYAVGGSGQLKNISTRTNIATGAVATAGFVVGSGGGSRQLLIRAIGPGLQPFGVPNTIPAPKLTLLLANQTVVAQVTGNGSDPALVAASEYASAFPASSADSALVVTVPGGNYTAQVSSGTSAPGAALVEVYDITGSGLANSSTALNTQLFLARLDPPSGATASGASGYAVISYNTDTGVLQASLEYSNLSGPLTVAHLEMNNGTGTPTILANLSGGSITYSDPTLAVPLQSGQIFVEVDTASYPGGELTGSFTLTSGSQNFVAPAPPPVLPPTLLSAPDAVTAARFLAQATFGPTMGDISTLESRGITGWIDDQMALPATLQLAATRADAAAFPNPVTGLPGTDTYEAVSPVNREAAWWQTALTAPDQLRQRVAFALSELFVVSEQDKTLTPEAEALANYYDILERDAFGNFRQLLGDVSSSPVMATYLTFLDNKPASGNSSPDENYAREVQQLFTIGLLQLRPDGSLALDVTGLPIPTYDQTEILGVARVFTGWAYANTSSFTAAPPDTQANGAPSSSGWLNPLVAYPQFHDVAAKIVLGGAILPAGQTAQQDESQFIDLLFNHPNTAPFVSRFLIQRLVTSNPSPGYIYRVAQVFANDGTGTRGNLAAVVRAILTDYEARSPDLLSNAAFGKIKEPLIRMASLFRAIHESAPNGRFLDSYYNDPRFGYTPYSVEANPEYFIGEGALAAPTVFNFFPPNYILPGPLASAGLVAPEMQLANAQFNLSLANQFSNYLFRNTSTFVPPPAGLSPFLQPDFSDYLADAKNPAALVDDVNLVICGGQMSAATQQGIISALGALQPNTSANEIVGTAFQLAITSPDGARQK